MKKLFSVLLVIAAALQASAQQMPPVPVDPAVRIGHLDNGLTYYIRHNGEPAGQANFYIAQKVGSILEEENQRGLAHFLEHMSFNGTQHFPGNGVVQYCEKIGVKFGVDLNAYTSIDETVYNIDNVPVGRIPDAVDSCLWILRDWAAGLLLEGDDIDHERGVIHEEWRTRSNAMLRQYETILPLLYPGNRYGQRLPIGLMEVVDNFPYQALRDYYRKWYRPDQQGIVVVGDIDVDAVEAGIKDIFGTIAKPENPAERVYFDVEDNKEPIVILTTDKEQPYSAGMIFCKHDAVPASEKGDMQYLVYTYARRLISMMYAQRLDEIAQQSNPPFIQAGVEESEFFISKTKYALSGEVVFDEASLGRAVTTLYREMLRAVRNGFTASEYDRARAEYLTQVESDYNQREKRKSTLFCREYVRHFIDNEPIPGIENEFALAQQLAPNIPVEVINQILASMVKEGNLAVVCMLPEKDGVAYPSQAEVSAMMASVEAETIAPYEDKVSDEPLISELPVAGRVVRKEAAKFGYTRYILSNGANVYFRQTDFNKDEIRLDATSWGGRMACSDKARSAEMKCAEDVWSIGGVGNFSVTELRKALSGKKVAVTPSIREYSESIEATSTPKDLETMMQLLYLNFTSPRADREAFTSYKTRLYSSLKNAEADPIYAFQDSIYSTVFSSYWRFSPLKAAQVDGLDYDGMLEFARSRFANAADFTFVITGNVDEETLVPLVEQYIASLPAVGRKERCSRVRMFKKGSCENLFDRKMEIPMVTNLFFYSGDVQYNLKNDVAFKLATQALTTILLEEIREKEGGTYGISAHGSVISHPYPEVMMQIGYQTNPDRYEYLNARVAAILDDFATNAPKAELLDKGREYLIKKYNENLRENAWWSESLKEYLLTGMDVVSAYETMVSAVSADDVRAVVSDMLSQKNDRKVIMHGVSNQ